MGRDHRRRALLWTLDLREPPGRMQRTRVIDCG